MHVHQNGKCHPHPHRQRFSAVRLWPDAESRASTGSMFSFLVPTRFSDRLTTFRPDTSSRLPSDWRKAPMSSAVTFYPTGTGVLCQKRDGGRAWSKRTRLSGFHLVQLRRFCVGGMYIISILSLPFIRSYVRRLSLNSFSCILFVCQPLELLSFHRYYVILCRRRRATRHSPRHF